MMDERETLFRRVVISVSTIAIVVRALLHEPWRDELHTWAVARAADSVSEMIHISRYDGHCKLWYLCVMALERLTGTFAAVQVFHALVASATIAVVTCFAPFTRLQRALFPLGYFAFFEYAVIARPYAIAFLAVVVACAAWNRPGARARALLCTALFLLTQTSIYGVILAAALSAAWIVDSRWSGDPARRRSWGAAMLPGGIAAVGALLAAVQMKPPADAFHAVEAPTFTRFYLRYCVAVVGEAMFPISSPSPRFWNSIALRDACAAAAPQFDRVGKWLPAMVGAGILAVVALLTIRTRAAAVAWLLATAGIIANTYVVYFGFLRHHGHVFVAFIAVCWLAARGTDGSAAPTPSLLDRWRSRAITVVLVAQAVAGLMAAGITATAPFSRLTDCAAALRDEDLPLAGHGDAETVNVAALVGRPMFLLESRRWGSFVVWDKLSTHPRTEAEIVEAATALAKERGSDVRLVLHKPLAASHPSVELTHEFPPGIVHSEGFYCYRVSAPR